MSTNKLDKIKKIFSSDQKEIIITQDGKRNLYFDRNRKNYIKFSLEVTTTCSYIQKAHKEEINKKLQEIYGKNVNLKEFSFLVVELIANKYEGKPNYVDLKIGMNDSILFNLLQNSQLMLCYLPTKIYNNSLKKNIKNLIQINTENLDLVQDININKEKKENNIEIYLPKTLVHYYNEDKKGFTKEKIKVTEKEINIFAKKDKTFLITSIKEMNVNLSDVEKFENKKFFDKYIIIGEKPKYCIEIKTVNNEKLLIGRNTFEHFVTINKAIRYSITKFKNHNSDQYLSGKLTEGYNELFGTSKFITSSCLTINDLINNKEKRKIFFKYYNDKNLENIIDNIIGFKRFLKKKNYKEAINCIKMIIEIYNENIEKEDSNKYEKIINKEKIEKINNVIKNIIYDENNNNDEEQKHLNELNELNEIINDLYFGIKEELSKFYEENNLIDEKRNENFKINNFKIIEKSKLLLGYYFTKIFNINKENDVLDLGGKEIEKIIKNYNNDLMQKKLNQCTVLFKEYDTII